MRSLLLEFSKSGNLIPLQSYLVIGYLVWNLQGVLDNSLISKASERETTRENPYAFHNWYVLAKGKRRVIRRMQYCWELLIQMQ